MGRVDQGLIGQGQQLAVQGVIQLAGKFLGCDPHGRHEIRPPYIANEESVPGEHGLGAVRILVQIIHQNAHTLRRVTGGLQEPQAGGTKGQRGVFQHGDDGELRPGVDAHVDGGTGALTQFKVPRQKVGMQVGEEDMSNGPAIGLGIRHVLVDIPLRIHHGGRTRLLIHDQIRRVSQAAQVILLEKHGNSLFKNPPGFSLSPVGPAG